MKCLAYSIKSDSDQEHDPEVKQTTVHLNDIKLKTTNENRENERYILCRYNIYTNTTNMWWML